MSGPKITIHSCTGTEKYFDKPKCSDASQKGEFALCVLLGRFALSGGTCGPFALIKVDERDGTAEKKTQVDKDDGERQADTHTHTHTYTNTHFLSRMWS